MVEPLTAMALTALLQFGFQGNTVAVVTSIAAILPRAWLQMELKVPPA